MKIKFLIITIFVYSNAFNQDTQWAKKQINEILTFNLPTKYNYSQQSFIKNYSGYLNSNFYGFQFYDSVFNEIVTDRQFQISLAGFIEGRKQDTTLKKYSVNYFDTTIGGTKGVMVKYKALNPLENYQQIYYYVTIANSRFYFFYVYSRIFIEDNEEIDKYFNSIFFQEKLVKENLFVSKAFIQH